MEIDCIYNMDCMKGMQQMKDDSVDTVVTSPPYNICLRIRNGEYVKRAPKEEFGHTGNMINRYSSRYSDDLDMQDYYEWQCKCIGEMLRVCRGVVFYNIQLVTGNKEALFAMIGKFSEHIRDIFIWDKKSAEPAMHAGIMNSEYEFIIAFEKGNCRGREFKVMNAERGTLSNIIRIGKNRGGYGKHRAAFPLALPQYLIHYFSPVGATILDPFLGSGTTALASIEEKRHYIGFEIDEEYYKMAERNISNKKSNPNLFDNID